MEYAEFTKPPLLHDVKPTNTTNNMYIRIVYRSVWYILDLCPRRAMIHLSCSSALCLVRAAGATKLSTQRIQLRLVITENIWSKSFPITIW